MANTQYRSGRRYEYKSREMLRCTTHPRHSFVARMAGSKGPVDLIGWCAKCRVVNLVQVKSGGKGTGPKARKTLQRLTPKEGTALHMNVRVHHWTKGQHVPDESYWVRCGETMVWLTEV